MQSVTPQHGETVIFKDLCFQAAGYVSDEFLASVTNTFVLRHPDLVFDSLRRLKPDFTEEEFGFASLGEMFERVVDLGQCPVVVEGDQFRAAAAKVLRAYCALVGLPFHSRMLQWRDGRIRAWASHERESQEKWHATLEASTSIEPPSQERPSSPSDLGETYSRALEIYDQLATWAISPSLKAMAS